MNVLPKIAGTAVSRVVMMACNLGALVLVSRYFGGARALGTAALINIAVTIFMLVANLGTGTSLVYLSKRSSVRALAAPAFLWLGISLLAVAAVFRIFPVLFPEGFFVHIMIISALHGGAGIYLHILLGREAMGRFNAVSVVQAVVLAGTVAAALLPDAEFGAEVYAYGLMAGHGAAFGLAFIFSRRLPAVSSVFTGKELYRRMFGFNTWAQAANTFQLGSQRLLYYLTEILSGRAVLGVFSIGNQLSEAVWVMGKSMATVQYARISNTGHAGYQKRFTLRMTKLSVMSTTALWAVLASLPESVFTTVFSDEIVGVKPVILFLGPGIVALSANFIFSHYFSGTGRYWVNTVGSGIGLLTAGIAGYFLLPAYGISGAAAAGSTAYVLTSLYSWYMFKGFTDARTRELIPGMQDFKDLRAILQSKGMPSDAPDP